MSSQEYIPSHASFEVQFSPDSTPVRHQHALFFHLIFKFAAIFVFIFSSLFSDNFVLVFVICIILCSFDFYIVKNITGRLLAGLRWWNEVKDNGTSVWQFESDERISATLHPGDSQIFWISLYLYPIVWLVLGLISIWQLKWLLVVVVAIVLAVANSLGYYWCNKDAKQSITSYLAGKLLK